MPLKEIKSTPKEKEVHWKIPNFLLLSTPALYVSDKFKFLDVYWQLKIEPSEKNNKDHIALHLYLTDVTTVSYNVRCTFGIKKADDSLIALSYFKHSFCAGKYGIIAHQFFTRSALFQHKPELVPSNELTILCNFNQLADPVKLIEPNLLSENIRSLLTDREFYDITLNVKDAEFKAHRNILAARSPVFAAMFKHDTSEKQSGIVNIPDCDPESFQEFLEYLYCGYLKNISFRSAFYLYKTADKYDIQELKEFCVEYMEHNLTVENIFEVVILAEEYNEKELGDAAQDFFTRNLGDIFVTSGWNTLFKNNFNLANKLLIKVTSNFKVVEKSVRWEVL